MLIVQYLSEYITAVQGDEQKIAEFQQRYGYMPKPYLRDGINDARYYKLSNYYADEHSRYTAAVRLYAVVVHEPKVAPPRGKQREVIRQWLMWLSGRQEWTSSEELFDLCKRETGTGSIETINSIINQTAELNDWRNASLVAPENTSHLDSIANIAVEAAASSADAQLLENLKNNESYRVANAKDRKAMKKAFAKMTIEERLLYFSPD
jgi:hypothetical protein